MAGVLPRPYTFRNVNYRRGTSRVAFCSAYIGIEAPMFSYDYKRSQYLSIKLEVPWFRKVDGYNATPSSSCGQNVVQRLIQVSMHNCFCAKLGLSGAACISHRDHRNSRLALELIRQDPPRGHAIETKSL